MSDFKRGGQNFGGNRDKRRGSGGGGRSMSRPDMHKAVCSDCGKNCEVPFRPSGDKPVFCSDCFNKQGGGTARIREPRSFESGNARPSLNTENYAAQFEQLNSKLDKILKAVTLVVPEEKQVAKVPAEKIATVKPAAKKTVKKTISKKKK